MFKVKYTKSSVSSLRDYWEALKEVSSINQRFVDGCATTFDEARKDILLKMCNDYLEIGESGVRVI
jgi:hypothetical protein